MKNYLYDNLAISLSNKISTRLDEISAEYNFDYGDEFEIALCEILRNFLPIKYGICRGFIVDKQGNKAGDDIIIYDQERFPTLKLITKDDWSRKENIPIEAVYCYIEAKYTLDISNSAESNLQKALLQINNVKELISKRSKYAHDKNDPYHASNKNWIVRDGIHPFRNPVFTMIVSRYVSYGKNRIETPLEISKYINQFIKETKVKTYSPEAIVVGKSHYITTSIKRKLKHPTHFVIPNDSNEYLEIHKKNLALAIAFIHLFGSIDWIRLDIMPWDEIFNDLKNN